MSQVWIVLRRLADPFASALLALVLVEAVHFVRWRSVQLRDLKAWLSLVLAEIAYLKSVNGEALLALRSSQVFTKRMNTDVLKEARLAIFRYDKDTEFLQCLTNAYGNVVHTNGMLDLFQTHASSELASNVRESIKGSQSSLWHLEQLINEKLGKPFETEMPLTLP